MFVDPSILLASMQDGPPPGYLQYVWQTAANPSASHHYFISFPNDVHVATYVHKGCAIPWYTLHGLHCKPWDLMLVDLYDGSEVSLKQFRTHRAARREQRKLLKNLINQAHHSPSYPTSHADYFVITD